MMILTAFVVETEQNLLLHEEPLLTVPSCIVIIRFPVVLYSFLIYVIFKFTELILFMEDFGLFSLTDCVYEK